MLNFHEFSKKCNSFYKIDKNTYGSNRGKNKFRNNPKKNQGGTTGIIAHFNY